MNRYWWALEHSRRYHAAASTPEVQEQIVAAFTINLDAIIDERIEAAVCKLRVEPEKREDRLKRELDEALDKLWEAHTHIHRH